MFKYTKSIFSKFLLIVLLEVFLPSVSPAQTNMDSLWGVCKNQTDTIRLACLSEKVLHFCTEKSDSCYLVGKLLVDEAAAMGDIQEVMNAHKQMALLDWHFGRYQDAVDNFRGAANAAHQGRQYEAFAQQLNNTAYAYRELNLLDSALIFHQRSYEVCKERSITRHISNALYGCGHISKLRGDYLTAMDFYHEALDIAVDTKDSSSQVNAYIGLGAICRLQNNYVTAVDYYSAAENHMPVNKPKTNELKLKLASVFANVYGDMGDTALALVLHNQALRLARTNKDNRREALILSNLSEYTASLDEKRNLLKAAYDISLQLGNERLLALSLNHLAACELSSNNFSLAKVFANEALSLSLKSGRITGCRDAHKTLSETHRELGNPDSSMTHLKRYYEIHDSIVNGKAKLRMIELSFEDAYKVKALKDSLLFVAKEAIYEERTKTRDLGIFSLVFLVSLSLIGSVLIYRGKKKSDKLLLNILPQKVAEELKISGRANAKKHDLVSVLFTDFKGFTEQSEKMEPEEVVEMVNEHFTAFDKLVDMYGLEKIKTIGDSYMVAAGIPEALEGHAVKLVQFGLEIQHHMNMTRKRVIDSGKPFLEMRVGLHSGPVVAGVVGIKKFTYDIWGDTVNIASRVEQNGDIRKVNISESTYQLVKDHFECAYRGEIEVKGKGNMRMYFVN